MENKPTKNICVLLGSPRKNGNTISITLPFIEEFEAQGYTCNIFWLYEKEINPCTACRVCQSELNDFGCPQKDDAYEIFDHILNSELIVIASPIHSWYCTPPTKSLLDRLVYGMNKYYGEVKGSALWKGKNVALITTCGYEPEKGADLWEDGVRRYCKHSHLNYLGHHVERDLGYKSKFIDEEKILNSKKFAKTILEKL